MTEDPGIRSETLSLLSLCELFSDLDASSIDLSELAPLISEIEVVHLRRGDVLLKQGPPVLSGGHMLIDGGVLNNQPGDILKKLCGGSVIVSNVSPRSDATVDPSLTEMPSAWRVLRSRMNPFEPTIRVPGISATMMRTLMVASERKSREVERMADSYLRPPIERFRFDDFARVEEIAGVGYEYAREEIRAWEETGRLHGKMLA